MNKWKIAIVGSGYMAREHAKAFNALKNVEIIGFCGRTFEKVEKLAIEFKATAYKTIDEMYKHTKADVVVVAVNEESTKTVCMNCIKYPWICLVEKPVGLDLDEAIEIQDAAAKSNARVYVALNRRSYSSTRQSLSEINLDASPRLISVLDQQDIEMARSFGATEKVIKNYMYANSIHLIDYFHIYGRGDVISVEPFVKWEEDRPGFVVATLRFSSGDIGIYQAIWDGPGPWSVTVTNRQVRIENRPLERSTIQRRGTRQVVELDMDVNDINYKPGLKFQAEQIVNLLQEKECGLATLIDATKSMILCAEIYGLKHRK